MTSSVRHYEVQTAAGLVTGFIATPTPDFGEEGIDLAAALERKARNVGVVERVRYRADFPQGFDVTARSRDVRRELYKHLVREVDFVIVALDRLSEGCMRIFSWSSKLGIPTYAVELPLARQSALLGAGPGEGPVTAEQRDSVEEALCALAVWQRRNLQAILGGAARRAAAAQEHREHRERLADFWESADTHTRELVSQRVDLAGAELNELLDDPLLYAAASPVTRSRIDHTLTAARRRVLDRAGRLDVPPTVSLDALPQRFLSSMNDAVEEYDLPRERVGELVMAGLRHESHRREAELVGEPQRLPELTRLEDWGTLIEELPDD